MDIKAIADALAARFAAAAVTPPTGYDDTATATAELPNAITTTPTCLVFPPELESSFSGYKRSTNLVFPVRWYIAQTSDRPRSIQAVYAWQSYLLDQLEGSFDLDQTGSGVTHAVIVSASAGTGEYAEQEYAVVEFTVVVHVEEGHSPTT